jgi:hypothetical protein
MIAFTSAPGFAKTVKECAADYEANKAAAPVTASAAAPAPAAGARRGNRAARHNAPSVVQFGAQFPFG